MPSFKKICVDRKAGQWGPILERRKLCRYSEIISVERESEREQICVHVELNPCAVLQKKSQPWTSAVLQYNFKKEGKNVVK